MVLYEKHIEGGHVTGKHKVSKSNKICSGARVQKFKSGEQRKLYYEASGNIRKETYGSGLEGSGNGVRTQF